MQVKAPMVIHSASMSQGGPFGGNDDDKIWFTLTSPPRQNSVLEREQGYSPPDTSINIAVDRDMAQFFPAIGSNVQITIQIDGETS